MRYICCAVATLGGGRIGAMNNNMPVWPVYEEKAVGGLISYRELKRIVEEITYQYFGDARVPPNQGEAA